MVDEFIGVELPGDGLSGKQQVGVLETRDIKDNVAYKTAALSGSTVVELTITTSRRYYIKASTNFHIESRLTDGSPTDPTATSPLVESSERIATYLPAGARIKALKETGEVDGRIWVVPN